MQLLITFLTVVLVLNCLLLMLLVLIQLPKKEAGAGLAFGGGATDALFGAGSGNALTKLTKYAAGTFLAMSVVLGIMNSNMHRRNESDVRKALATQRPATAAPVTAPTKPAPQFQPLSTTSTNLATTIPAPATNAPATAVANTNAAAPRAVTTANTNGAPK
jgi:preprotein translocase subunit SecG